jgi:hypothetical protein
MAELLMLVPPEFAVVLILAAGLAFICQARRLGGGLLFAGIGSLILPALIAPFLTYVPIWILLLATVVFGFAILRAVLNLGVGRRATDHAMGVLVSDFVRFLVVAPFRILGGLFAVVFRRGAP